MQFPRYRLPPANPSLKLDSKTLELLTQAMLYIGKLNEVSNRVPNSKYFIKSYIYKEALLSCEIEGINTTLLDVFTQPFIQSKPNKETQLVLNYNEALFESIKMIKKENIPISTRLILRSHQILLQNMPASGEFRKQSVSVGNFIPAPANYISQLMSDFENYINDNNDFPGLIQAGLAHVQFEIIHPFLDGNGRIGRLLIILMLIEKNILTEPIIYPSLYFKKNKLQYYNELNKVHTSGDFESWLVFYLTTMRDSCIDAYQRIIDIEKLENRLKAVIENSDFSQTLKEARLTALNILFNYPIINVTQLSQQLDVSYNTADKIINDFLRLNILIEDNQQKRGKLYKFVDYLNVLEKEYVK